MSREILESVFRDLEDLLLVSARIEDLKAQNSKSDEYMASHLYAKRLCKALAEDLRKIERKYKK